MSMRVPGGWRSSLAVVLAAAVAVSVNLAREPRVNAGAPLYSDVVALDSAGSPVLVTLGPTTSLVPGSRVLRDSRNPVRAERLAQLQLDWLGAGVVPGATGPFAQMARNALLDLHVLSSSLAGPVAAGSARWRYVWPRDASFAAAALAVTGHQVDAERILDFLQRVQGSDGRFQARYLPDGSGVPDDRGVQLDGSGWALWAVEQVAAAAPSDAGRVALLGRHLRLVQKAASACLAATSGPPFLPAASPDYWEKAERRVTLGTAAPMYFGLLGAAAIYRRLGDSVRAAELAHRSQQVAAGISATFGRHGYPRYVDGGGSDAAVSFLLPPFTHGVDVGVDVGVDAGVERAWRRAQRSLLRPAGGLAPGEGWKQDGISWTPETALFALTAAGTGDRITAQRWLKWLNEHRTKAGSLPEKVLASGKPATVAPLAWTSATVLLTLSLLDSTSSSGRISRSTTSRTEYG
jgi:glucoamylase